MVREKTVFDPGMVGHLWANQIQDYARNQRGNISCRGKDLYSYGTVIATHVSNRGKTAVLITTNRYSMTTNRHQSIARRAANHLVVFHVGNLNGNPLELLKEYGDQLVSLVERWKRSRCYKPEIARSISETVKEANQFAEFYGLRCRLGNPENMDELIESNHKIEKANQNRLKRIASKRRKEMLEQQRNWLAGTGYYYPPGMGLLDEPVRLRVKDDELQTSLGAKIPLDHALKAFKIIKLCHDKKVEWKPNGRSIHLGHFTVNQIESNGNVKAGCHYVQWKEIKRIATLLKVA